MGDVSVLTLKEPVFADQLTIIFHDGFCEGVDFLSAGGKFWAMLEGVAKEVGLIGNLRTVVAAIRKAGIQVFVVPHRRWEHGDLRDYLAAERTFLAWVRTGLALMGFGFVVARAFPATTPTYRPRSLSTVLRCVAVVRYRAHGRGGVAVNVSSAWRHVQWFVNWTEANPHALVL